MRNMVGNTLVHIIYLGFLVLFKANLIYVTPYACPTVWFIGISHTFHNKSLRSQGKLVTLFKCSVYTKSR